MSAKKNVEVKPCPFCGKDATVRFIGTVLGQNRYTVRCTTSRCYGSGHDYAYSVFTSKEEAIKAWNIRKG